MAGRLGAFRKIFGHYEVRSCFASSIFSLTMCAAGFRDDMSVLLSKAGSSMTVQLLLDTLQQTTEFESSIAKKWATSVRWICISHEIRS